MSNPGEALSRVRAVRDLLALPGVTAPDTLTEALAAFDAVTEPARPEFDASGLKEKDIPALLDRLAYHAATKDPHGQARGEVQDALGLHVFRSASAVVDAAAEALRAEFDATATEFAALLTKLPDTHLLGDAEHIARRGTDVLTAWGQARDAAARLDTVDRHRAKVAEFGYQALIPGPVGALTRFAWCDSVAALDSLPYIAKVLGFNQWPGIARTEGVTLRWVSPAEQSEMVTRLEASRPEVARRRRRAGVL